MAFLTYQDFDAARDVPAFIRRLIAQHNASNLATMAHVADEYDAQRNTTINRFVNKLYTESGAAVDNPTSANNRIASNFFNRLNTQRAMYSLGNGITLTGDDTGALARLDADFDNRLRDAGYYALIHGVSFVFLNVDHCHVFRVTEFAPLWDEEDGRLRGGVRYWRFDATKPMTAVLYTEEGFTVYREDKERVLREAEPMRAYRQTIARAPIDADGSIVGADNYGGALPIVPLWGSRLHQSTLVGMRAAIDSYDLVRSGFANDLQDCAQIFWIMENYGGMRPDDLAEFRARLLHTHIAAMDTGDGGKLTPYAQDIPYQARAEYLASIRKGIYEDFGGVDVAAISASNQTATAIESAYQPMDENADDFEFQIISCVRALLALVGVDAVPVFKRNRITNQQEQVQMVMQSAQYLDTRTILQKLPFVTPDEVDEIMERTLDEDAARLNRGFDEPENPEGDE